MILFDILKGGPEISNGYAKIPEQAGLMVLVNEDAIRESRVKEFPKKIKN